MTKTLISLAAVSLGLAACTNEPVAPAPAPVVINTQPAIVTAPPAGGAVVVPPQATVPGQVVVVPAPAALRAGYGRVESIMSPTASAGGTVPTADDVRRFGLRMEDGTFQYVDARAPNLAIGQRVEITRDGYIRSPA